MRWSGETRTYFDDDAEDEEDGEIEVPEIIKQILEEERMEQQLVEKVIQLENTEKPKILPLECELTPISDNLRWFWIGWSCPLTNGDFRQLCRHMLCWRVAAIDKN